MAFPRKETRGCLVAMLLAAGCLATSDIRAEGGSLPPLAVTPTGAMETVFDWSQRGLRQVACARCAGARLPGCTG